MTLRINLAAFAVAAISCCGIVGPATAADQPVEIRFAAKAANAALACGRNYTGIGTSKASMTLQDFRIYISNVRLIDSNGRETAVRLTDDDQWQGDGIALLDFENASGNCNGNAATNTVVRGSAPEGPYRGLIFDLGVPTAKNHQDPTVARAPLNFSALSWPWRAGYKYTTIDIETGGGDKANAAGFSIHLGATDCGQGSPRTPPSEPCASQNRPTYSFDRFDAARNIVVFDLAALLAESDITVNMPQTAAGCMSSPADNDCAALMSRLGLPFRDKAAMPQAWVRVE